MDYFLIPREVVTKIPDAFGNGKSGFLKNFLRTLILQCMLE